MPPSRYPLLRKTLSSPLMRSSRHIVGKLSSGHAAIPAISHRLLQSHSQPRRVDVKPLVNSSRITSFSMKSSHLCSHRPLSSSAPDLNELEKLQQKLRNLGFECIPQTGQRMRSICPQCEGGDSKEKSLSLLIHEDGNIAFWHCFRGKCGWSGYTKASDKKEYIVIQSSGSGEALKCQNYRSISEEDLQLEPLCKELIVYFNARSISIETLDRNAVKQRLCGNEIVIAFAYRRNGKLVSCNYLDIEENSRQEKDTESIFYGLDDIVPGSDLIIVDSEVDKLSMQEAGYPNCISVPNGKVSKVSEKISSENEDASFRYLWNCKEYLEQAPRLILATNAHKEGQVLAEELARRLGKERCWRVKWPMKSSAESCKGANEVLNIFGEHVLKEVIENAEMFPMRGLLSFSNFFPEINDYYHCTHGFELGVSTGWRALDDLYNIVPGELTVITGVPSSGKSDWVDALLCNINERRGWTFALCSMENEVRDHARKLLEKYFKKPFFNYRYGVSVERISLIELEEGKKWLSDTFHVIRSDDDCPPSINWVLKTAKSAVLRHGVRGLVIDSYNELDHQRFIHRTETEYVSHMLTMIKRFAQHHSCHVWFVAHPKQLVNWGGDPPSLYDISGSSHFINKCDNGLVIHRNKNGPPDSVQVSVRKVRNKVAGRIGDALLSYDWITGMFHDINDLGGAHPCSPSQEMGSSSELDKQLQEDDIGDVKIEDVN